MSRHICVQRATFMTGRYPFHTGLGPDVICSSCGDPYGLPAREVVPPFFFVLPLVSFSSLHFFLCSPILCTFMPHQAGTNFPISVFIYPTFVYFLLFCALFVFFSAKFCSVRNLRIRANLFLNIKKVTCQTCIDIFWRKLFFL